MLLKNFLVLGMVVAVAFASPPAAPSKPPSVKVGSTTEAARTIEFIPGVGTTYSLSCADGTCSLTINYTGNAPDVVDYTGATRTAPVKTGTTPPATCTVGDWFFDTDASAGRNIALCTATNTWTYLEAVFATLSGAALTLPSIAAYTVATLPTPGTAGRLAVVTDAATAGSCTSGGGTSLALCRDSGSVWVPLGDGGSGGGGGGGVSGTSYVHMPAARCQYGAASTGFSIRSDDAPTPTCYEGANTDLGVLQFPDSSARYVQTQIRLEGAISSVGLTGVWRSSVTSGSVVWQVQIACVADGDMGDPAWGTAVTVTDAAKSTANQFNEFAFASVNACPSNTIMLARFFRDPTHASDDLNATAELVGLTWTIERSAPTSSYISMSAANCQYGAAATAFSMRAADSPTTACYEGTNTNPVSYTHLTLPTIYSV